jgi:hypothetical protein
MCEFRPNSHISHGAPGDAVENPHTWRLPVASSRLFSRIVVSACLSQGDDAMIRSRSRKRMTIAQLKRHVDRRFADTRKQIERCATKDDLQRFATKDDLQRFATKDDLQRFATKDDLAALESRMNARLGDVTSGLDGLNAKMDGMFKSLTDATAARDRIFDEHEERIRDLEAQERS